MTYYSAFLSRMGSLGFVMLLTAGCTYDQASEVTPALEQVSYQADIKPIVATHCYSCHTANATDPEKAGYAFLDDFEELKRYALRPSTSNASMTKLQARLRFVEFPGMPFKQDPLPEADIHKIEAWIKLGAPNN
ncbi:hypothetical protein ACXYMU_09360 [Pontibacter sp. CAU 1760]